MVTEEEERVLRGDWTEISLYRFSSSENFVCEREEHVIYEFINFKPE